MPIRWKLLALLLVMSAAPLLAAAWLGQRSLRQVGEAMAQTARTRTTERAMMQLHQLVGDYSRLIDRERALIELTLADVAREVEIALARPAPVDAGRVRWAPEYDAREDLPAPGAWGGESAGHDDLVFVRLPGAEEARALETARRMRGALPAIRAAGAARSDQVARIYATVDGAAHAAYPGHGGYPEGFDPRTRPWHVEALRAGRAAWTAPIADVTTGGLTLTVAQPLHGADGGVIGVAAVDVPLREALRDSALPPEWTGSMTQWLVRPLDGASDAGSPDGPAGGLAVFAMRGPDGPDGERAWDAGPGPAALPISDAGRAALTASFLRRESGVVRAEVGGEECVVAHGPIDRESTQLVLTAPVAEIEREAAEAAGLVRSFLDMHLARAGAVALAAAVAAAGLALLASRTVTRPVHALEDVANRMAAGDFDARCAIRTGDELERLGETFNEMGAQLKDAVRMRAGLAVAQEAQQSLLPREAPTPAAFEMAGRSVYCDETGGDYYDFVESDAPGDARVLVAVADVTGHGVGAALSMASARALLRMRAMEADLEGAIGAVNASLARELMSGRFVTLLALRLDGERGAVEWVSAGHDPAIVYDPGRDAFEELAGMDIPLGVDARWRFTAQRRGPWAPGTVIVLATDGVWEARNERNEFYGKDRLREVIRRSARLGAGAIADATLADVAAFRGERAQHDDVTLIVMKAR